MTILSFGALFAGLGVTSWATGRRGAHRARRPARVDDLVDRPDDPCGAIRTRLTPAWIHRINVASGVIIGAFAVASIASVIVGFAQR